MQAQTKLSQPVMQVVQEQLCVFAVLEPEHGVVGVAYDDHVALRFAFAPPLGPKIEDVVQVDVRQ